MGLLDFFGGGTPADKAQRLLPAYVVFVAVVFVGKWSLSSVMHVDRGPGADFFEFVRLFAQFGAPEYHVLLGPADPRFVASSDWPAQWAATNTLTQ